jgi:TRAP-type C4-dicarboxylate transport system substrate-binding protein
MMIRQLGKVASLVLSAAFATSSLAAGPTQSTRTIRCALAHTAIDDAYKPLFDEFAKRIAKKSGGSLKFEFVRGYGDADPIDDPFGFSRVEQMLHDGSADIGQVETNLTPFVPGVTAPFAFRSYQHAEVVFNGPLGKELLARISAGSPALRALAFAYSGGERVIIGRNPISKLSDFKGQVFSLHGNPTWSDVNRELMDAIGATLVPGSSTESVTEQDMALNRLLLYAERYPDRSKQHQFKFINLTRHSLLVTTMVASESFLASLTPEQRALLTSEIKDLAADERHLTIELEPKRLKALTAMGLKPVEMPDAERRKLKEISESILKKHPDIYRQVLEIRAVKEEVMTAKRP